MTGNASLVAGVVFGDTYGFDAYWHYDGVTNWVNSGIISMNSNFIGEDDLIDSRAYKNGYFGTQKEVTIVGQTRNCYIS